MLKPEGWENEGVLKSISSKILMKILYGARTCRWDLLHAVNTLAREVTKWNKNCDIRLHKLMCYVKQSSQHSLEGWIGDSAGKLKLVAWCDADFAGDMKASKSTSGAHLALVGPNSFFPLSALCKKQSVVSHSSTESEIVSLEYALRTESLPILTFWDIVMDVLSPSKAKGTPGGGDQTIASTYYARRPTQDGLRQSGYATSLAGNHL